jgi:hypothetical protein
LTPQAVMSCPSLAAQLIYIIRHSEIFDSIRGAPPAIAGQAAAGGVL